MPDWELEWKLPKHTSFKKRIFKRGLLFGKAIPYVTCQIGYGVGYCVVYPISFVEDDICEDSGDLIAFSVALGLLPLHVLVFGLGFPVGCVYGIIEGDIKNRRFGKN